MAIHVLVEQERVDGPITHIPTSICAGAKLSITNVVATPNQFFLFD